MAYVWNADTGEVIMFVFLVHLVMATIRRVAPAVLSVVSFQETKLPSTLSSCTPLLSTACPSTLTKTWLLSAPSAGASLSACTCTIAKVCGRTRQVFVTADVAPEQSDIYCTYSAVLILSRPTESYFRQLSDTRIKKNTNDVILYHTVSQLEVHNIKAASRSASADTRTMRNTPDPPALQDTSLASTMDQFAQATRLAMKMQCVKEQLDSVLVNTIF